LSDAIQIQGLHLAFGERVLLDDFALRVPSGARCTFTGPSGCGKSTLMKCVLGFEQPTDGTIRLFGMDLRPETVWDLRRKAAWVPQEAELGDGTAREFLSRAFSYRANRGGRERLSRADKLSREFLLDPSTLDQPVGRLSGGEKQRVALIAALLLDRPLLLLDEPFSALDSSSRAAVLRRLSRLPAAIVCAAHEPIGLDGERTVPLKSVDGNRDD
jgi:ABC-type multidrug transport system ATPase subunit